jgi:hypothetical protein
MDGEWSGCAYEIKLTIVCVGITVQESPFQLEIASLCSCVNGFGEIIMLLFIMVTKMLAVT